MQAFSRFIRPATGIRRLCSPVLNFNNAEAAYKPKSTWEIARTLVVFQLCAQPWLVNNSEQLLHLSKKVIGETATHAIVKQSLFAHFCAGENEQDIQPVLRKLEAAGVGTC